MGVTVLLTTWSRESSSGDRCSEWRPRWARNSAAATRRSIRRSARRRSRPGRSAGCATGRRVTPFAVGEGRRIDRLAHLAASKAMAAAVGLVGHRHGRSTSPTGAAAVGLEARRSRPAAALASSEPGHMLQLGPLAGDQDWAWRRTRARRSGGDDLARNAHELLLVLDEAQADLLLGDLGVALDGLLSRARFPRCAGTRRPK
jgi:hypothetical protein